MTIKRKAKIPYLIARTSDTGLQIPELSSAGRIVRTISSPAFPLFTSQQRTHNWNKHKLSKKHLTFSHYQNKKT
jgi:hypothetical protein